MTPKVISLVIDGTSGNPELEYRLAQVFQEYLTLWKKKQQKYGPHNISAMGKPGLVVRMHDKYQRLNRFVFGQTYSTQEGEEGEEDAWLDMLGYSAMGVMLHRGWWPDYTPGGVTLKQILWLVKTWLGGRHGR